MNEKTNGTITKWMKIAIEVGILLFAVAVAWSTLRGRVTQNYNNIEKHDKRIVCVESDITSVKSDIREINVRQEYISEGIDEIKDKILK